MKVGDKVRVVTTGWSTPAVGCNGVIVEHDRDDAGLPWRVLLTDGDRVWFNSGELTIIEEATA